MSFIDFAGGSAIFAAFLVFALIALCLSTYSRRGSAISQRAYGKIYGGAPGAFGASDLAHDRNAARRLTRGTG
jgi:hypothetical protein